MKKQLVTLIILLLAVAIVVVYFVTQQSPTVLPDEQIVENVIPAEEPYYSNTDKNEIVVSFPHTGSVISSPLTITGQARGTWFFEATAPVSLVNWDGLIIAEGYIMTTEDWMTTEFVNFVGTLEFTKPDYKNNGALILQADNPSDLPEYDRAVEIPIIFAE